jgi:hypothetical protein
MAVRLASFANAKLRIAIDGQRFKTSAEVALARCSEPD